MSISISKKEAAVVLAVVDALLKYSANDRLVRDYAEEAGFTPADILEAFDTLAECGWDNPVEGVWDEED